MAPEGQVSMHSPHPTHFLGSIEAIDEKRGKVKVLVSIFDRETPVELDFLQVAKL